MLFPAIDALLGRAGVRLSAVDCFAVTSGPGAFTGLRVGLAAAKGLAEANRKVCAAVSTLRVLASLGSAEKRAAIVDARRGQVYAAMYDSALRLISPETVADLRQWVMAAPQDSEFILTAEFHAVIRAVWPDALLATPSPRLADALARCAELDGAAGLWTDPATVDANYVRRSDAEMFWRDASARTG